MKGKPFWKVHVDGDHTTIGKVFYIFARNAKQAEERALKAALEDDMENLYCTDLTFKGYVL